MEKIAAENLDLDYCINFLRSDEADQLFMELENKIEYYDGELTKVKVFGKWHQIPRQQVAYGDPGLVYTFSGVTIPAKPWIPALERMKMLLLARTGHDYNFVLVNRYRNGNDHIGEHRDDEDGLDRNTPIASLSLGQQRVFLLKHADVRKRGTDKRDIPLVKLDLHHGSLLLMNPPTNQFWYHSLPIRKSLNGIRINLTFRKIINKK